MNALRWTPLLTLSVVLLGCFTAAAVLAQSPALEEAFRNPPDAARPHTWWHWMNGNISREGITADLEAMTRVGVGGAQIFDVDPGIPPGPVRYGTAEWRAMVKHAASEAQRLGVELCLHNCAGWSSSGGPWVTPEHAMQMLVVSETQLAGPSRFQGRLPQPYTRLGYYRDIAVLAFPTPPAEVAPAPTVTANGADFDPVRLTDGNPDTVAGLPPADPGEAQFVQWAFAQPVTVRALTFVPGYGRSGERGELQVSEDGVSFRAVAAIVLGETNLLRSPSCINFAPVTGRVFRLSFAGDGRRPARVGLAECRLETGYRISGFGGKAGYSRGAAAPDGGEVGSDLAIASGAIMDLTRQMTADGHLKWDFPAGHWTILRFGYTPTGKDNHPAAAEGRGLECDKLSREAAQMHFSGVLLPLMKELGPLAGTGLRHLLIDSYEVDCQNWTPRLREEFTARRGYDPLPYLPTMTGRVVGSLEESERFLWDFRRTLADLYTDNYFGAYADICRRYGLQLSIEPYGNGNFNDLDAGGQAVIPMTEFWVGWGADVSGPKLASSVAHTYGRKYVGAEAFTADNTNGRWQNHPAKLKALGDLIYTGGVNRFIFHRYAHQPWMDVVPGMTMGPWGFHFERTNTWWEQGSAWLQYLTRCQFLLQEGRFSADFCYLVSEDSPNSLPGRGGLNPAPPEGYDYDGCNAEVVLTRMGVHKDRLVLPDGMSYRFLVLPGSETVTPALLRKVCDLVRSGATVIGPRPMRSPSLQDQPAADGEVAALARELWGNLDGKTRTERRYGRGTIIWGKPLAKVLSERGLRPDFEYAAARRSVQVHYIHRTIGDAEVYFVASSSLSPETVECTFRVASRLPELWDPETGDTRPAPLWRQQGGRTTVIHRFDPNGSVFVVFRRPAASRHVVAITRDGQPVTEWRRASKHTLEIVKAVYGVLSAELPDVVDVTRQVAALVRDNRLALTATNALAGDPAPNVVKQLRVDYTYGGAAHTAVVEENQSLSIPTPEEVSSTGPGELRVTRALYGLLPPDPIKPLTEMQVDVTDKLREMVDNGVLSVVASNALGGDPAYLVVKQMRVDYLLDGQPFSRTVPENATLEIPDGTEFGEAVTDPPSAQLETAVTGLALTAWEAGRYEMVLDSGRRLTVEVGAVPAPVELTGPWEVRFPPGLGAPPSATFPRLTSWTESEDPRIRYFSGTATYRLGFDLPTELAGPERRLVLDLGRVCEIAHLRVNGRDLGILWKPPYRTDVTGVARPGRNELEIEVTNLWVNRLIGDEQLPDDCEWAAGGALARLPEWLVKGTPRPATGRVTFTTWKHWTRDDPLLDSGLLGPVTVRCGLIVKPQPAQ